MRGHIWAGVAAALTTVAGCGTIDFSKLPAGKFSGGLFVMWVGEGGPSGSGLFVFVPDPEDPLKFERGGSAKPAVISPKMMYTDGGSIPRIAQVFKGFSPWGYAPAYMVHDWIFTAHHCLVDGFKDERYAAVADISFKESAEILGEAIKTLVSSRRVRRDDFAPVTITDAVDGPVAQKMWDEKGACAALQVKPEHVAAAEAAIPGSALFSNQKAFGPKGLQNGQKIPAAKIISRISF